MFYISKSLQNIAICCKVLRIIMNNKDKRVVIGVCARNEESCIISTLESIRNSANNAGLVSWCLVVCANGCSDNTIPNIQVWQSKNPEIPCVLLIRDQGSLVEAQREIFKYKTRLGYTDLIFFGADILADISCVGELLKYSSDNQVQAVYAISIPINKTRETLVERALNQYDVSPTIFSVRKHLHGRAFLIKDWYIPETIPPLFVDDVFLSFYLLEKYGAKSIVRVPSAKVYFHQIASYKDFFNTYRRRNNELRKCFKLFPSFMSLPADQINRIIIKKKVYFEPIGRLFIWGTFFGLRIMAKIQYKFNNNHRNKNWAPATTTKVN